MKKLTKAIVLSVFLLSVAFTGAFAAGQPEGVGKGSKKWEDANKASEEAKQKAKKAWDASRDEAEKEKEKSERELERAEHKHERRGGKDRGGQ